MSRRNVSDGKMRMTTFFEEFTEMNPAADSNAAMVFFRSSSDRIDQILVSFFFYFSQINPFTFISMAIFQK